MDDVVVDLNPDAMDTFLKTWGPTKSDDGDDRYVGLFVIMGPSGKKSAAFPTWPASENMDREELRAELHKWLDCAIDKIDEIA